MELRHFRYVVAVAETQNFTRAAERCHIVQSALSHQIKALETELGVRLFARTSRRVELTAAGKAFLVHAQAALAAAEHARAAATASAGELRGTLTVGLIPTVTLLDIPKALEQFHRAHPSVHIRLRDGDSGSLTHAIQQGDIDLAVLGLPDGVDPQQVRAQALGQERHVAVVSKRHRLAKRQDLSLAELADELFADFPTGSGGRAQTDIAFAAANLVREVTFEAMNTELICNLVARNLAVALLPEAFVSSNPELRSIPLAQGPGRSQYLAWSNFHVTPPALAFLEMLGFDPAH